MRSSFFVSTRSATPAWLDDNGIRHIRGRPYHPMTQGKIERYHRSMKNRILLDNYYLPGQLEQSIEEFVSYYNNCRYHESLDNLTPAPDRSYVDRCCRRGPLPCSGSVQ